MNYKTRKPLYDQIEKTRNTKVITYVTGERPGASGSIEPDCIRYFVDVLETIGVTNKISLILHTHGGNINAGWRIVNLIKMYCKDEFEVIIPQTAASTGTLIALGANKIVMTKQAALGTIDPLILNHSFKPDDCGAMGVEDFYGFFRIAMEDLGITTPEILGQLLNDCSKQIHPLVMGNIFRAKSKVKFIAEQLLENYNKITRDNIIKILCTESVSHSYSINRRQGKAIGLPIEKPSQDQYSTIYDIFKSFSDEMQFTEVFNKEYYANNLTGAGKINYKTIHVLIESSSTPTISKCINWECTKLIQNNQLLTHNVPVSFKWQ